ncbi:Mitochondrial GTPase 1 [Blastocladiella emersonii ATCC 22665]|nr:Mitochondrial GTPase 1 [Blastocladiella emersonii ATCC 22665]
MASRAALAPLPPHLRAINWYPGHMTKGLREMRARMRHVDLIIEVRDARVPLSAVNLAFEKMVHYSGKDRVVLLNKSDLADAETTRAFARRIEREANAAAKEAQSPGKTRVYLTAVEDRGALKTLLRGIKEKALADPLRYPTLTMMVAGTPNVGKSTLLNSLRNVGSGKRKAAITGGQPGVTRALSGTPITVVEHPKIYVLDSPGIMDPSIRDPEQSFRIALTGGIRDHIAGHQNLAEYLVHALRCRHAVQGISDVFEIPANVLMKPNVRISAVLDHVAKRVGALERGGLANRDRAAAFMVQAFRAGRFGKITLDLMDEPTPGSVKDEDVPAEQVGESVAAAAEPRA